MRFVAQTWRDVIVCPMRLPARRPHAVKPAKEAVKVGEADVADGTNGPYRSYGAAPGANRRAKQTSIPGRVHVPGSQQARRRSRARDREWAAGALTHLVA